MEDCNTQKSRGRRGQDDKQQPRAPRKGYNHAGDLDIIAYNDESTPSISYGHDRLGRQTKVTRNGITTTIGYNLANHVTSESYSGGILDGFSVTLGRDSLLRRSTTSLGGVSGSITTTYGYDNASRLQSVSDGTHSATYTYVANSPLVDNIVFKQSTTTRMTTRKQYDKLNRLLQISFTTNSSPVPGGSYSYLYNNANQRTRVTLVDGSYWIYEYDKLGQVTSGKRYWSDGTPVAGQQFEYAFDDIGNRNSTKAGGDSNGAGLRTATYTPNRLNQYCENGLLKRVVGGILLVLAIGLVLSTGCRAEKRAGTAPLTNLVAELDGLYRGYLTNDYIDAKRNVEQAVELLHRPNQRKYAERGLWLNYGRLYCLEARFGDSNVAHLYYEKARYWYLVNLETDGKSPSEISSQLQHFSQEQCKNYIQEWDAVQTAGKGAKYLQDPKP